MRTVTFFHKTTGVLNGTALSCTNENAVTINTPADYVAIDLYHPVLGTLDALRDTVDPVTLVVTRV